MTAIWQNDGTGWHLLVPTGFPNEATLHSLVEESPHLLPLAGSPQLIVLGLCRVSGLPVFYLLSPANVHDAPFAQPLLEWAVRLFHIRPHIIHLDAAYWGLRLIHWIHTILGAVAVIP